jgi:hypothetical protein
MPLVQQEAFQNLIPIKIRDAYQQVTSILESQAQKRISSFSHDMTKNVMDFDNLGNDDLGARCPEGWSLTIL